MSISFFSQNEISRIRSDHQKEKEQNKGGFLGGLGYLGEKIFEGLFGSVEGIWDYTAGGLAKLFGADDWAEEQFANDWIDYNHADEWFNPSDGWKTAGDVAQGIGNSVPSLVAIGGLTLATGGTALPAIVSKALIGGATFLTAGLSAAGNATKEAYRQTGELGGKEFGYGTLSGLTEGTVETFSDMFLGGVGGQLSKGLRSLTGDVAAAASRQTFGKMLAKSFLSEGLEEVIGEFADPFWKRATYDPDAKNATLEELAYAGFVGGMSGLIMSAGGGAFSNARVLHNGSKAVTNGRVNGILQNAQNISSYEAQNNTELDSFKSVDETYSKLQESLRKTNGEVRTVKQKLLLGQLDIANTAAVFDPIIQSSARNIYANADVVAQRMTELGYTDDSGNPIQVTAEQLRAGIDTEHGDKAFSRSFSKALKTNSALRTLAVLDATGKLMIDAGKFKEATLRGERLASQVDLNRFIEATESEEGLKQRRAVAERLGIEDWNKLTAEELRNKIVAFEQNGGAEQYIAEREELRRIQSIAPEEGQALPQSINLEEGEAKRYNLGDSQFAVERTGEGYRLYDYESGQVTKNLTQAELNTIVSEMRAEEARRMASMQNAPRPAPSVETELNTPQNTQESVQERVDELSAARDTMDTQAQEIDSYARKNIEDYNKLGAANQSMIRSILRQGRAAGVEESFVLSCARVSARSGINVVFSKELCFVEENGTYADGGYSFENNRIAINPEAKERSGEQILIHELTHAIYTKEGVLTVAEGVETMSAEEKEKIRKRYAKIGHGSAVEVSDEINAHFAEETLSDQNILERLVQKKPTVKGKILAFFKGAKTEYSLDTRLSGAAEKLFSQYQKLFDQFSERNARANARESMETRQTTEENVQYVLSKSFSEQVDDVISGKHNPNLDLYVSETPQVFLDIGFEKTPLLMRTSKINNILRKHTEMSAEIIKKIPQAIQTPLFILKSKTNPTESVVAITDIVTKKGEMVVPVWIKQDGVYLDVELHAPISQQANFVASAYGRNAATLVQYAIENSGVLYVSNDTKKIREFSDLRGLQLPTRLEISNFEADEKSPVSTDSIRETSASVKQNAKTNPKIFSKDIRYALLEIDSEGRTLSEQQRTFFADSKVVDEDGHLLVVHHGTHGGEFTVFEHGKTWKTDAGWLGEGFYFYGDEHEAQMYAMDGGKVIHAFLNVKHPYYAKAKDMERLSELDDEAESRKFTERLIKKGYDGVYFNGDLRQEWVVFNANQIKLTTNKNPSASSNDIRFALPQSEGQQLDNYSLLQYNNFGWVRANDVISSRQWADFNTKFTQAKNGRGQFVKTKNGDFIIPVNDMTADSFGVDNVLVYARGSLENPKISKIVKIDLANETDIDIVRRQIYDAAAKSWTRESDIIGDYYESELIREYSSSDFQNYQEYKRNARQRSGRQESRGVDEAHQRLQDRSRDSESGKRYALSEDGEGQSGKHSDAQWKKIVANHSKNKVYLRSDAEKVIDSVIADRLQFDEKYGTVKGKQKVIDLLFERFNDSPKAGETIGSHRLETARDIADYIIENTYLTDIYAKEKAAEALNTLSVLRRYLHGVDLSGIRDEIQYRFDRKNAVNLVWGAKEGGISPDVIAQELETDGIYLDASNPADQFFQMLDLYHEAQDRVEAARKESLANTMDADEIEELRKRIVQDILTSFRTQGTLSAKARISQQNAAKIQEIVEKYQKIISETKKANKLTNNIIDTAKDLREIASKRKHVSADVFNAPELTSWLKSLGRLVYRSDLRKTGARQILLDYGKFYNTDNNLLYDGTSTKEAQTDGSLAGDMGARNYIDQNVLDALDFLRENEGSAKPLSFEELQAAQVIVQSAKHLYETYDQIIMKGKKVSLTETATQGIEILQKSKNHTGRGLLNSLYAVMNKISEPRAVIRSLENYDPNGVLTRAYKAITDGETMAGLRYIELVTDFDDFFAKHKQYKNRLSSTYITVAGAELSIGQAVSLYELSKREQAQAGLYEAGFGYIDKSGVKKSARVTEADIVALESHFTEEDREFIRAVETFFNEKSKQLKTQADMEILGYTNASDDFYFPIQRDRGTIARNVTDARSLMADWANVYNFSFNKDVRMGAKNKLFITGVYDVVSRHAKQLSTYSSLTVPLKNFAQLYAKNIGTKENVVTIANILNENVWGGTDKYLTKLFKDIQGTVTSNSFIEKIRSAYAKYQLGANLKVIVSQVTSYPTAGIYLDVASMTRGATMKTDYTALDKYCAYARVRNYERGIVRAEGVLDKVGKVGDVLTKPIQWTDRLTIGKLWNACQVQVERNGGAKVGTEANMKEAGVLLEDVIRLTQPNYTNTERSELMRSDSDLLRSVTMFTSVPLKQLSRLVESFGEYRALRESVKSGKADAETQNRFRQASKHLHRTLGAITIANLMYCLVGQFFKWLYAKDRKDKDGNEVGFFKDLFNDFVSTSIGMFPIVRDIYNYFANDYEFNNFAIETVNNVLSSSQELFDLATKAAGGEATDETDYSKALRDSIYSIGQLTGLPFRNINNLVSGLMKRFAPSAAYRYNAMFYNAKYSADMKAALDAGDEKLAETIMSLLLDERGAGGLSDEARAKVKELYEKDLDVLPRAVGDTVTLNGETRKLSEKEQKIFLNAHETASREIGEMIQGKAFSALSDTAQAKAIKRIFDSRYEEARCGIFGVSTDDKFTIVSKALGLTEAAPIVSGASEIVSDETNGKTVQGSRKKKVIAYLRSQSMTDAERLLLLYFLGYKVQDKEYRGMSAAQVQRLLAQYISKSGLARDEKTVLAEMCGFTVKNGKIMISG